MTINVMLQLCKITRASKLFQRNFYLPLLKPLSPKDALRRKIITGQNILGARIEHYIPVLEDYQSRVLRRRTMPKGLGKKRQRKKQSMRYVMPFLDEDMDGHSRLKGLLGRKSKGRGQCYTYHVPDKNLTLVINHQMERAVRDKDILDIVIAQRSDKIVVKLNNGTKITLPYSNYDGNAPFYYGEGWTRKEVEEYHHHGRETMSIAKLFEAKEQGVSEWELEMMRMASKRKKKQRGEGTADWKAMMAATTENMDWNQFEEDTKQILEEEHDAVEDEPIAMEVDDMDKTMNVNEKFKAIGESALQKLPVMLEIPEILKVMRDGEMSEFANVSGIMVNLPSSKLDRFICGQIVTSEDGDTFVPGQTLESDEGVTEYTPGFTVMLDGEPTLLPGLVMGNDPDKLMFLPGESTITEYGELQFTETEDDFPRVDEVEEELVPVPEVEEIELEEEQNSEDEEREQRPPPKPVKKEFIYERPKREYVSSGPKHRERGPKKIPDELMPPPPTELNIKRVDVDQVLHDLTTPTYEKEMLLQEKDRVDAFNEKKAKEEVSIDKRRREIKLKAKELKDNKPPPPKYVPLDPVKKSEKLKELEKNIKKGKFFDVDHKKYLQKTSGAKKDWKLEAYDYRNTFESVGVGSRHRIWKPVI